MFPVEEDHVGRFFLEHVSSTAWGRGLKSRLICNEHDKFKLLSIVLF